MSQQGDDPEYSLKIDYLWKIHEHLSENVRFADTKAGLIIIFVSTLIGALHTTGNTKRFYTYNWSFREVLVIFVLSLMLVSIIFSVMVVLPRLLSSNAKGIIFWEGVLMHGSSSVYGEKIINVEKKELMNHLADQVYDLAIICALKYKYVKYSLWFAIPSALVGAFIIVTL